MPQIDPEKLLAENTILRLLAELPRETKPFAVEVQFNGLAAALRIGMPWESGYRSPSKIGGTRELSHREQEVFDAVKVEIDRLGRRVPGAAVRAALKAAGIVWGVSTVNTTLADLVEKGLLVNDNDKRGYGLSV